MNDSDLCRYFHTIFVQNHRDDGHCLPILATVGDEGDSLITAKLGTEHDGAVVAEFLWKVWWPFKTRALVTCMEVWTDEFKPPEGMSPEEAEAEAKKLGRPRERAEVHGEHLNTGLVTSVHNLATRQVTTRMTVIPYGTEEYQELDPEKDIQIKTYVGDVIEFLRPDAEKLLEDGNETTREVAAAITVGMPEFQVSNQETWVDDGECHFWGELFVPGTWKENVEAWLAGTS